MLLTDYHTHSVLSPDGNVPLARMADAAVAAGLGELCITDHCDLMDQDGGRVYGYNWPAAVSQFRETVPMFQEMCIRDSSMPRRRTTNPGWS